MMQLFSRKFFICIISSIIFIQQCSSKTIEISSYARVSKASSNNGTEEINNPQIHRISESDLFIPNISVKTSQNVDSFKTENFEQQSEGRSIGIESRQFPYPSRATYVGRGPPRYLIENKSNSPNIVYPVYKPASVSQAEFDKMRGKSPAMDRYTPGEAVATAFFKNKSPGYNYSPPKGNSFPDPQSSTQSPPAAATQSAPVLSATPYVPPKNLYAFPPNIDANYLPPEKSKPKDQITSYLPPAAGYDYSPPKGNTFSDPQLSTQSPPVAATQSAPVLSATPYVPPKNLYAFPPNIDANYLPPEKSKPKDQITSYLPPAAGYDYSPPKGNSFPDPQSSTQSSSAVATQSVPVLSATPYVPPKNLYAFPPNIDANYLPNAKPKLKDQITSYLPPAAGSIAQGFNGYAGPLNPDYLPPYTPKDSGKNGGSNSSNAAIGSSYNNGNGGMTNGGSSSSFYNDYMDSGPPLDSMDTNPTPPPDYSMSDTMGSIADDMGSMSDMGVGSMPNMSPGMTPSDDQSHDHDHDHHHHKHHPWDSFPSFYHGNHGIDAYPEIIYDDDPHHHHHHHEETTTTTTTEAPPPEPRVKKYSYFYIGRKLWYVPLYFTVWFAFYITYLILKSIARHKVNLPNHYQRSLMRRSTTENISHKEIVEKINRLTEFVMSQIEDFKEKYL